jgi:hypothetical protein
MKRDLRMEGMSPDPDDLASDKLQDLNARAQEDRRDLAQHAQPDHSAPHVPPLEDGRIRGEE